MNNSCETLYSQQTIQVLQTARDLNRLIAREDDPQRLMDEICKFLVKTREYRCVWIGQPAAARLRLVSQAGNGLDVLRKMIRSATFERSRTMPCAIASQTLEATLCADIYQDERYAPWRDELAGAGLVSTIAAPLIHEDCLVGVLNVFAGEADAFDDQEVEFLQEIAADIAFGIHSKTEEKRRKQAQQALASQASSFRALSEDSLIGRYIIQDGLFKYVNPALARFFGYQPDELIGASPLQITHLDDQPVVAENIRQRIDGEVESIHYFLRGVCKNGEVIYGEVLGVRSEVDGRPAIVGNLLDITSRKKAEDALKASERSYHGLFNSVADGIFIQDPQGCFIDMNEGALKMYGRPKEFFIGRTPEVLSAPGKNDMLKIAGFIRSAFAGQPQQLEFWGLRSSGEVFPQEVRLYRGAYFGQDCVIALVHDITERKRAEEALRQAEEQFRAVVQNANDAILTVDVQQTITFWNQAAEKMFGYRAAEIIGQPMAQIIPQQFRERSWRAAAEVLTNHPQGLINRAFEASGVNKDGYEFPLELSLSTWQSGAGTFITAIARDIRERKQREDEMRAIATLSSALRASTSRAGMMPVIIEQLEQLIHCDAVSIEMIDPETGFSVVEAASGPWKSALHFHQSPDTGLNQVLAQSRKPFHVNNLDDEALSMIPSAFSKGNLRSIAGVDLVAAVDSAEKDCRIGFLWVGSEKEISFKDVQVFSAVADIAANAIRRATLHEQTQRDALELARAYDTALEGWAHALELRNQEAMGHSERVVEMTLKLAHEFGLDERQMDNIRRGAILHDIGKMGVPDSILQKPGSLTEREWEIMRQHPVHAYQLLSKVRHLEPALDIPYCHHEKWNGTGYPRGLKGEEIPLAARIFAIVDVWDALLYDRPYRSGWPQKQVAEYLAAQAGKHFDPQVVEVFLKRLIDQ